MHVARANNPYPIPNSGYFITPWGQVVSPRGKPLKPWRGDRGGHVRVDIDLGRKYVHQLVAVTFIGLPPPGQEVRHLNGIPDDNRVDNLAYGTRSENVLDAVLHRTYRNANRGKTNCPRGHRYDTQNTHIDPRGCRRCRACRARWGIAR